MMNNLKKLLEISSKPILEDYHIEMNIGKGCKIANELKEILEVKNGFYAFEGALHFFSSKEHKNYNIWKKSYKGLADDIFCFGEDAFGNQFSIKDDSIYFFDAETAETEFIANNFEEWAKLILDNYNFHTAFPLMHKWQIKNGIVPLNSRLVPKKPFVMGGKYDIDNLYDLDSIKSMQLRGKIAYQIKNLPDGSTVKIDV